LHDLILYKGFGAVYLLTAHISTAGIIHGLFAKGRVASICEHPLSNKDKATRGLSLTGNVAYYLFEAKMRTDATPNGVSLCEKPYQAVPSSAYLSLSDN